MVLGCRADDPCRSGGSGRAARRMASRSDAQGSCLTAADDGARDRCAHRSRVCGDPDHSRWGAAPRRCRAMPAGGGQPRPRRPGSRTRAISTVIGSIMRTHRIRGRVPRTLPGSPGGPMSWGGHRADDRRDQRLHEVPIDRHDPGDDAAPTERLGHSRTDGGGNGCVEGGPQRL